MLPGHGVSLEKASSVLPNLGVEPGAAETEAKLNDMSIKVDCRIRLTDGKFDSRLFSIAGLKEALPFASSLIREAFFKGPHRRS